MPRLVQAHFWKDARHYQVAALTTLVVVNLGWIDFGARPDNTALALAACLVTQFVFSRWAGEPLDLRSPLITGLSLSLLLRADEPWLHALAGVIAIGSKFLLRIDGKHIWNPAGFAIVVLLVTAKSNVWISPGACGSNVWFGAMLCFFAILLLVAAMRSDIGVLF
ncbi:MAG: enediyne biosynthesis protein, partial [Variibacter sp.]|nr:enediyne biosynthesis protein [Variibacter sp.]